PLGVRGGVDEEGASRPVRIGPDGVLTGDGGHVVADTGQFLTALEPLLAERPPEIKEVAIREVDQIMANIERERSEGPHAIGLMLTNQIKAAVPSDVTVVSDMNRLSYYLNLMDVPNLVTPAYSGTLGIGFGVTSGAALASARQGGPPTAVGFVGDGGALFGSLFAIRSAVQNGAYPIIGIFDNQKHATVGSGPTFTDPPIDFRALTTALAPG